MIPFDALFSYAQQELDRALKDQRPSHIVLATMAVTSAAYLTYQQSKSLSAAIRARHYSSYSQRVIDFVYDRIKNLPWVKAHTDKEINKFLSSVKQDLAHLRMEMPLRTHLPREPQPIGEILRDMGLDAFNSDSRDTPNEVYSQTSHLSEDGRDSGALYAAYPDELKLLLEKAYSATALTNPLHDKWPRVSAMQAEVIRWAQTLFHGDAEGFGLITNGGTSSIIEAMAAYVQHAREERGISNPEIVVPETAHAAFDKAAKLCGARLIVVPVDKLTGAVTARTMRRYLSSSTAVMVGSAPSFMNGICDPIEDLGALAKEKKIPFHVDACLGGFLTCFLDDLPPMDFRVPGVTSISADTHKYGLCPKGTSICLFSKDSPCTPVYSALNWAGGMYTTPGFLNGSTSGARIAEIYAVMLYHGFDRYRKIALSIVALREALQKAIIQAVEDCEELTASDISIYADPKLSVLGFRSDTLKIHAIAEELDHRGWKLNSLQKPDGFHFCLTSVHTLDESLIASFTKDLIESTLAVKAQPEEKASGQVKVYGTISSLPHAVVKSVCRSYQQIRLGLFENYIPNDLDEFESLVPDRGESPNLE